MILWICRVTLDVMGSVARTFEFPYIRTEDTSHVHNQRKHVMVLLSRSGLTGEWEFSII